MSLGSVNHFQCVPWGHAENASKANWSCKFFKPTADWALPKSRVARVFERERDFGSPRRIRGPTQRHGSDHATAWCPAPTRLCFPPSTSMEGSMNAVSSFVLAALLSAGPTDGTRSVPTPEATLLQFTSQRCQFCQAMQPIVAQLAQ